jgi:hypothetical protein
MDFVEESFQSPSWSEEPNLPSAKELILASIDFLWSDSPGFSMLFFEREGDDRSWHVSCEGLFPVEVMYDH